MQLKQNICEPDVTKKNSPTGIQGTVLVAVFEVEEEGAAAKGLNSSVAVTPLGIVVTFYNAVNTRKRTPGAHDEQGVTGVPEWARARPARRGPRRGWPTIRGPWWGVGMDFLLICAEILLQFQHFIN